MRLWEKLLNALLLKNKPQPKPQLPDYELRRLREKRRLANKEFRARVVATADARRDMLAEEYAYKMLDNRLAVKGNPFLGIKGTHQYVARISRGQLTRRMRSLRGPLLAGCGE